MNLEVITGIDYITQHKMETVLYETAVLISNGMDVFNAKTGLRRYIDFFDSYGRYMNKKNPKAEIEIKKIDPTPKFLEG